MDINKLAEQMKCDQKRREGYNDGKEYARTYGFDLAMGMSLDSTLRTLAQCVVDARTPEDKAYYTGYEHGFKDGRRIP